MQATRKLSKPQHFYGDVGFLLRRAGFGGTPDEVDAATQKGLTATIAQLVDYEQIPDTFTPPPAANLTYGQMGSVYQDFVQLSAWWIGRMLTTQRPLQEKMTLFWHGHFATAYYKVRSSLLMYRQNQLFRDNALGRFDDLLGAVYKDPAMLVWLDGQRNVKGNPNENFGREVMELFTLGIGNYTEDDVHAMARAFTGWRLDTSGTAVYIPRLHDDGVKTILGQTGNWTGDDAVRILAAHPATGPFLAGRLWRFFASDQPPAAVVAKLAGVYYSSDHSIREVVRTLFSMPEFYAPAVRAGHIKSPTEFVVTTLRQLGIKPPDLSTLPRELALLGQELFNPPNVGGWNGGANWVNASTMLERFNFASYLTGDIIAAKGSIDTQAILAASGLLPEEAIRPISSRTAMVTLSSYVAGMLGVAMSGATRQALLQYSNKSLAAKDLDSTIRGLVHLALVSPEYQAS